MRPDISNLERLTRDEIRARYFFTRDQWPAMVRILPEGAETDCSPWDRAFDDEEQIPVEIPLALVSDTGQLSWVEWDDMEGIEQWEWFLDKGVPLGEMLRQAQYFPLNTERLDF